VQGLVPNQRYRWLIAEIGKLNEFSATITGFSPDKFAVDLSKFREAYPQVRSSDFWLDIDANGIHLNALVVPEPATAGVYVVALAAGLLNRRLRLRRR
jgi:hypothetical protein